MQEEDFLAGEVVDEELLLEVLDAEDIKAFQEIVISTESQQIEVMLRPMDN